MKKSELKTIIRTIVREEVAMAIKEVITELKKPTMTVTPPKKTFTKAVGKEVTFTKDKVLNEILNETATNSDWEELGGGTFDSGKINDVMKSSYGKMMNDDSENKNGTLAAEMGVNPNDPAMNFLKKDYRAVMKAVDKKQGK